MFEPPVLSMPARCSKANLMRWVERMYLEHCDRVFAFFRYRVREVSTAEDLTARTFQRVVERAASYKAERGSEAAWLFAVARHILVDHLRHFRRRPTTSITEAMPDDRCSPEEEVLKHERVAILDETIALLPGRMQLALSLKYGGGLSHAEMGQVLHISEKQVGILVHRARQKLKPLLERRLSDETIAE